MPHWPVDHRVMFLILVVEYILACQISVQSFSELLHPVLLGAAVRQRIATMDATVAPSRRK